MFSKVLVANRGEIAVRIIRSLKELGIKSVAIYSTEDRESLHVQLADQAVCVGSAKPKDSYLNMKNILAAAVLTGAEAIHPGFGFLSENSRFVELCEACGLVFIGPRFETIELMGNKANARIQMQKHDIPVIPGSTGFLEDVAEAKQVAKEVGYPVLLKAAAGGGGKGIRRVDTEKELANSFNEAKREAQMAFGDARMYLEKIMENVKHIEVQIFRDDAGNMVYFPERDCSLQRNKQKMIEESPCALITDAKPKYLGELAIKAAEAIDYRNTGTIEFLMDQEHKFYFMEMNTRIQVEHCVTEMISNVDLVREQIMVAAGEKLDFTQDDIVLRGHAIECRINAENPEKDFMPNPGKITGYVTPGGFGVRVDSHAYQDYSIPPYYDSMIGKLICWGRTRNEARRRMYRALKEYVITGVETTIPFHQEIIEDPVFMSGKFNTGFIEDFYKRTGKNK